ncbi:metallophosphoesterase [Kitasatospora sp. NPDC088134]|uniref:metallophosphoesterase n=1 Tax=Kitasatospora sp. NPDC088134 TaxID=3364071 RepID=UPI00380B9848
MTGAARVLKRILATTDVHSHLAHATGLLSHLRAERGRSLIVDCGDFFEGTGYYRLSRGGIEREVLLALYDVIAPGNHGWSHHFEPGLHELTVCANAVDDVSGRPLFRPLHLAEVGGRRVAVTAVIGPQAFAAIPLAQRAGHRATDPLRALRELLLAHHHEVDFWVLLSHSGFEQDVQLTTECPFLEVVFAGHCHSDRYGPETVGGTLVVKGPEHGAGYALAEPAAGPGWTARPYRFPTTGRLPADLAEIGREIDTLKDRLAAPLGPVAERWRNAVPSRRALLEAVAAELHRDLGGSALVVLNETALRPAPLGEVLRTEDLMAVEPFGNRLVRTGPPDDLPALLARLTEQAGPLVTVPDPPPPGLRHVLTTDYLAETFPSGPAEDSGRPLGQVVRHVLTRTPSVEGAAE